MITFFEGIDIMDEYFEKTCQWLPTILSAIGAIIAIWQALIAQKASRVTIVNARRQRIKKIYKEIIQWKQDIDIYPCTDARCICAMKKIASYLSTDGINSSMRERSANINNFIQDNNLIPNIPDHSLDAAYFTLLYDEFKDKLDSYNEQCKNMIKEISTELEEAENLINSHYKK